jgi:hypothetical protein
LASEPALALDRGDAIAAAQARFRGAALRRDGCDAYAGAVVRFENHAQHRTLQQATFDDDIA